MKKAHNFFEDANFDEALRLYYVIEGKSQKVPMNEKTKNSYQIYKDSMILYITIKEALVVAEKNNMDLLKEKLDYIHNRKRYLEFGLNSEKLVNFVESNYHYCLGLYIYNFYKKRFLKEFENIYYYMNAGWIDKALDHYNRHLLRYYGKLIKYGDHRVRTTLYGSIKNLYSELKMNELKQQAYSEYATYNFKNIPPTKREKIEIVPRHIKKIETMKFDKKAFKKMHELIKDNKADEASNLYNSL